MPQTLAEKILLDHAVAGEIVEPHQPLVAKCDKVMEVAGVIIEGKALAIDEDDVDTDVLYPGSFLNIDDPGQMAAQLCEGLEPSLRSQLDGDTVLCVAGSFGTGSSREHVPLATKASGIRCVVGKSFARIQARPVPPFMLELIASGGLVLWARRRVQQEAGA